MSAEGPGGSNQFQLNDLYRRMDAIERKVEPIVTDVAVMKVQMTDVKTAAIDADRNVRILLATSAHDKGFLSGWRVVAIVILPALAILIGIFQAIGFGQ